MSAKTRRLEIRDAETEILVLAYLDRTELVCQDAEGILMKSALENKWNVDGWKIQFSFILNKSQREISIENAADNEEIYRFKV